MNKTLTWRYALAGLCLIATLGTSKWGEVRKPDRLLTPLAALPDRVLDWQRTQDTRFEARVEARLAATEYLSRVYRRGNTELSLLVSYYAQQRAGESMHSPQACLPAAGWEPWEYGTVMVPVEGHPVKVNRYGIQKSGERQQVLYWYQSGRRIIASEYAGKMLLVWDSITGGHTSGALIRLLMADRPGALEDEIRFASSIIPDMQRRIGQ